MLAPTSESRKQAAATQSMRLERAAVKNLAAHFMLRIALCDEQCITQFYRNCISVYRERRIVRR